MPKLVADAMPALSLPAILSARHVRFGWHHPTDSQSAGILAAAKKFASFAKKTARL